MTTQTKIAQIINRYAREIATLRPDLVPAKIAACEAEIRALGVPDSVAKQAAQGLGGKKGGAR